MERTNTARSAPSIGQVLEVPASAREETRVFRTKGRLAEHRGRHRRHGAHAPTWARGRRRSERGKHDCRTERTGTIVVAAVLLRGRASIGSRPGAAPPRSGRAPWRRWPTRSGSRSPRTGGSCTPNATPARSGSSTRAPVSDRLFFRIGGVNSEGERGALGVALHPDWPRRPFVYVYVTRGPGSAPLRNQLIRLRSVHGHGRDPQGVAAVADRRRVPTTTAAGSRSAPTASSTS